MVQPSNNNNTDKCQSKAQCFYMRVWETPWRIAACRLMVPNGQLSVPMSLRWFWHFTQMDSLPTKIPCAFCKATKMTLLGIANAGVKFILNQPCRVWSFILPFRLIKLLSIWIKCPIHTDCPSISRNPPAC